MANGYEQFKSLSRNPQEIDKVDKSIQFPAFTYDIAWSLGCKLRSKLMGFEEPSVIDISLAQKHHCLFHCTTGSGTVADQDRWVSRKRNVVLQFGCSSWSMHNRMDGNEVKFAALLGLGEAATEYAIHGGGWPVRVKGVDGIVGVVVVSGLEQSQDHGIIVAAVKELLEELE